MKQECLKNKVLVIKLLEDLHVSLKSIEDLNECQNYQDDYNRRNNLQFIGMEENLSETWEQSADKV